jgi:hypothetical protein
MKTKLPNLGVEWAVLAFCAWQASDLVTGWRHSPFDRLEWLALGIWLTPTLLSAGGFRAPGPATNRSVVLAWLALAVCLGGLLTDMHFLKHGALALACAAVTPAFRLGILWLGLGVAWMPSLGWLVHGLPASGVVTLRLALATVAALIALAGIRPGFRRTNP